MIQVLPFPGGRHPRVGFQERAILPHRGTKASVFLPWDSSSYVVVDLPEAIVSNLGLIYLAHTHTPTIWDARNLWLKNIDWTRGSVGDLSSTRTLPTQITFGALLKPGAKRVEMELWLRNNSREAISGVRAKICVMLGGASEFAGQTNENKLFRTPMCAVKSSQSERWVLTASAIDSGTVKEGMSYQFVLMTFGDPEQKNINDAVDGKFSETWFYLKDGRRWVLEFLNGKVAKVNVY